MAYKDLAKDAAVIGFTQVMVNLGNFLLLPIITKTLGSSDYGLWTQVLISISLLSSVAMLGQPTSLLRFIRAREERRHLSVEYYTALYIVVLAGLALAMAMVVLSVPLAEFIFSSNDYSVLLVAAAMIVPTTAFTNINSAYFRATDQIKTYAAVNIFHAFGEAAFILVLVIGGMGVFGAVIGSLVAAVLSFFIGMVLIIRQIGITRPERVLVRRNLKFGLPLAPNNIVYWVFSSSDRYLVAIILSLSMAGIYSAAYGIGGVIFLLVAPIQMILYPTLSRFYDSGRIDKVKEYTQRSFRYYIIVAMPAVVGLSVLSTPLLVALTTPEFAPGAMVIPLIAIAGLLSGMFRFVENIPHLVKKTHLSLVTFTIPALTDVVLVIILTPLFGIVGTAMATVISYTVMLLVGVTISRQFMRFTIDKASVMKSVAASLAMAAVILLLDPVGLTAIAASVGLGILVYFSALFLLRGLYRQELDLIMYYLGKVRHRGAGSTGPSTDRKEGDR